MLKRTPEPELMDDPAQAIAYSEADFDEPNQAFVDRLLGSWQPASGARIVDLGCGPADIPRRLALALPSATIDGLDGAQAMLDTGRASLQLAGVAARVRLVFGRLGSEALSAGGYDAVLSNSLLHHLPEPALLWREVRRLAAPGGRVLVADLHRPESTAQVQQLVERYARDAPDILKRDFEASLHAAFTVDELHEQLAAAGLNGLRVERSSDRHLVVEGTLEASSTCPSRS